jgi:hypothetical protein
LKHTFLLLLLLTAIAAFPAAADTFVDVQLTGVSGVVQGGETVAPYQLHIGNQTNITAICDDYSHSVSVGEHWKATIHTFANLNGTRFGAGDFAQYAEAAWLFTKFLAQPSQAGNINFAIWALFSPSAEKNGSGWTTQGPLSALGWLTAAQQWFKHNCSTSADTCNGINLSEFEIITPKNLTGRNSPQEYITMVPESGSLALLGLGTIVLVAMRRKKLLA